MPIGIPAEGKPPRRRLSGASPIPFALMHLVTGHALATLHLSSPLP